MATVITTEGTKKDVTPKSGESFTLKELQEVVKGYIEAVQVGDNTMYVNEEGLLENLPLNKIATMEAFKYRGFYAPIVGDVIICSMKEQGE